VPAGGAIPGSAEGFPDVLEYDASAQRLVVGTGRIEPVAPAVWAYQVSGKAVVKQWFSCRRRTRERPTIGDKRPPSPLGDIQPDTWPAAYTSELLDMLNVLGLLVDLEPVQAVLLDRITGGALLDARALAEQGVFEDPRLAHLREGHEPRQTSLFQDSE
jgi:hypothetical protein